MHALRIALVVTGKEQLDRQRDRGGAKEAPRGDKGRVERVAQKVPQIRRCEGRELHQRWRLQPGHFGWQWCVAEPERVVYGFVLHVAKGAARYAASGRSRDPAARTCVWFSARQPYT